MLNYFSNWFGSQTSKVMETVKKTVAKIERFANKLEANIAHAATDLAYKLHNGNEIYKKHESETLKSLKNEGWKVLCNSSQFEDTNLNGFKSVVFVNEATKNVLIATAGTTADFNDAKDDFYIARGNFPNKVIQAKAMVNHTAKLLGTEANDYQFNFTGHSLGAVLSDAGAYEAMSRDLKVGTSITFDSPGSKTAISEARIANVFTNNSIDIDDLAGHCIIYNARHNIINYAENAVKLIPGAKYFLAKESPHITAPHLVLPTKGHTTTAEDLKSTPGQSGIWGFTSYLSSKVGSVVKTCSDHLGITKVLDEVEHTKNTHSLKNFANLCENIVVPTEDWKKLDDQLVINPKDIKGLANITPTGNDIITLSTETNGDNLEVVTKHEYAFEDLTRAQSYEDCAIPVIGDTELTNAGYDLVI